MRKKHIRHTRQPCEMSLLMPVSNLLSVKTIMRHQTSYERRRMRQSGRNGRLNEMHNKQPVMHSYVMCLLFVGNRYSINEQGNTPVQNSKSVKMRHDYSHLTVVMVKMTRHKHVNVTGNSCRRINESQTHKLHNEMPFGHVRANQSKQSYLCKSTTMMPTLHESHRNWQTWRLQNRQHSSTFLYCLNVIVNTFVNTND